MIKLSKLYKVLKNRTLYYEFRKRTAALFIQDSRARDIERTRLAYKKLERIASHTSKKVQLPTVINKKIDGNMIWVYWDQGYEKAPELVRACINSFRDNFPSRDVIVLDDNNISDYVQFPDYINSKIKNGSITKTHFSDLLRTELLCLYGGLWIDSTVLCTSSEKNIDGTFFNNQLFVFKEMCLDRRAFQYIRSSSWLISAKAGDPILLETRKYLYEYWKKYDYLINYFVFHLFFAIASRNNADEWKRIPMMNNCSPHTMMFELGNTYRDSDWARLVKECPFHKLERHTDYSSTKNTIYKKIIEDYL